MVDKKLPIDLDTLKTRLGASEQLKIQAGFSDIAAREALAANFDNRQWRFCPAEFHLGDEKDYYENHIIPILKKAVINQKGGFATVWQIEILEDFVGQNLRKEVSTSKFLPTNDNLGYVSFSSLLCGACDCRRCLLCKWLLTLFIVALQLCSEDLSREEKGRIRE